ncbi:MAG: DUF2207 domain-containing protein [Candidatus Altiarchaeota archaeon]|nr:DUF2207 domain-containing protein [Candidatus Altiarchaeota archaeon]
MTIEAVDCQGEPIIAYQGNYEVFCYSDFEGPSILRINYLLHQPYTCYSDMCYFEARLFDGTRVGPIEYSIKKATEFEAFPDPGFHGNEGIFEGEATSGYFFASVPANYAGSETLNETFQEKFNSIIGRYSQETRLESKWMSNLLLLISFEAFVAFLLFLVMGLERNVSTSRYLSNPPSLRPPHHLSCLYFFDLDKTNVINATIVNLASRGYLEVTRTNLRLHARKIHDPFEYKVLTMLSKLAVEGVIKLDRDWIKKRINKIGKEDFKAIVKGLQKMHKCPKSLVEGIHDKLGDSLVLTMQGAFVALSFFLYLSASPYLVNYRTSLIVLTLTNLFWILSSWKLGYTTFSRYTRSATLEKSMWLAYQRFVKSEVNLEKSIKLNWEYALTFATLFGFENRILKVAERRRIYFKHMYNARLATRAFDTILRAAH